jgi:hypothetical protein
MSDIFGQNETIGQTEIIGCTGTTVCTFCGKLLPYTFPPTICSCENNRDRTATDIIKKLISMEEKIDKILIEKEQAPKGTE